EDRELPADQAVPLALQLFRPRAHDYPVPLADREAEHAVPNRATDQIDLHPRMLTEDARRTGSLASRILLAGVLIALLQGCGTLYVAQAAHGQWRVMKARKPIAELVEDE